MRMILHSSGSARTFKALIPFALALAVILTINAPASGQGLKLDKAKEKVIEAYDEPNPHFELDCTDCHEGNPSMERDTWATVKFVNGEAGNVDLCYQCHDASDNIHPINIDPTKGDPPVKVPGLLPLEKIGQHKDKVVCSTCHFIHAKTAGLKLLRGFPESSTPQDMEKAVFKDRREMCYGCHGRALENKSPHKGLEAEKKNCAFCHAKEPKEGEPVEFTKGLIELCDFCHAATKGAHYLLVNPFADPNLAGEIEGSGVPLTEGDYSCVSCHNPHGGTGIGKYLRKEFVDLALKSARIRPHFLDAFCEACHKVKPRAAKGSAEAQPLSEIPLRYEDPNELCNRCHESGLSKANAHPIKKVTQDWLEYMPEGWPLYNGGLTCLTCHTAGDSPVMEPENPNFVRGAPYETRNDICWECHDQEDFAELNPHLDINEGEGCEFCHDTKPDMNKSVDIQEMKFKGDIILLCLRCHEAYPHPVGVDHTGEPDPELMEKANIQLPKDFPLDSRGRLTCATCHNPHAGGERRGVVVGMEICGGCHKR